ncbi:MAG: hypothetical protein DVB31_02995 [Verrucomicrobia bacterium]|nr:MAG: hypothetical protein DVB31_02995 [Verrucomicrobiota bacterium]
MRVLADIVTSIAPGSVAQGNFESIDRTVFGLNPTLVAGIPTTEQGPPTSGAWTLADRWVDALGGEWACTLTGTPGTWLQIRPAVVTADPAGTIADGYVITRADLAWTSKRWDLGGTTWVEVVGSVMAAVADATGGSTVDAEARTAINSLLAALRTKGLLAP